MERILRMWLVLLNCKDCFAPADREILINSSCVKPRGSTCFHKMRASAPTSCGRRTSRQSGFQQGRSSRNEKRFRCHEIIQCRCPTKPDDAALKLHYTERLSSLPSSGGGGKKWAAIRPRRTIQIRLPLAIGSSIRRLWNGLNKYIANVAAEINVPTAAASGPNFSATRAMRDKNMRGISALRELRRLNAVTTPEAEAQRHAPTGTLSAEVGILIIRSVCGR